MPLCWLPGHHPMALGAWGGGCLVDEGRHRLLARMGVGHGLSPEEA